MNHYVAIVEDAGPDRAVGVWFPDLPGCFSAGDTIDEALQNAPDAIALYAEALARENQPPPAPRTLSALRKDREFAAELGDRMVALVPVPAVAEPAE